MISHKGQFDVARKMIYWMIASVIITGVVFAFAFTVANYKHNLTKVPPELQAELLALRFTNTPECFAYEDSETGIVSPGIIALDKFTNEQMNRCYITDASAKGLKVLNFKLKLVSAEKEIQSNNYFNRNDHTLLKEVLVREGTTVRKEQLIIYVQEGI